MKAVAAGRTEEWLKQALPYLEKLSKQKSVAGLVITSLRYWFFNTEKPVSTFEAELAKLRAPKTKRKFMSLAEQLIAKGREEGREKGRQEGQQEGRQEGRQEGFEKGKLAVRIQSYQELLGEPLSTDEELAKLDVPRLRDLAQISPGDQLQSGWYVPRQTRVPGADENPVATELNPPGAGPVPDPG